MNKLFLAPEILDQPSKATAKSDIYSLGAILYMLITGSIDSAAEPSYSDRPHIGTCYPRFTFNELSWKNCSTELTQFVKKCVQEA